MNFNVYVDDATAERLGALAKQRGSTRNAIIREALEDWLAKRGRRVWPERVLQFEGRADFPPFESHRAELGDATSDPFAAE